MKQSKTWDSKREERLIKWYNHYKNQSNVYEKVAKRLKVENSNIVYKKLGRLGLLNAPWSKSYNTK